MSKQEKQLQEIMLSPEGKRIFERLKPTDRQTADLQDFVNIVLRPMTQGKCPCCEVANGCIGDPSRLVEGAQEMQRVWATLMVLASELMQEVDALQQLFDRLDERES